ncbi:MAG: polysaccharide biosynthesis C-terminal domain-containing protein [Acidimicrobiales bacterium]
MGGEAPAPPSLLGGYGRGVGWTYLSLLLTGGSTFFLAAWSVRRVGTAQYGLFALVTSLAALLTIFDYALGLTVQRAGSRVGAGEPDDENLTTVHAAHGAYVLLGLAGLACTLVTCAVAGLAGPAGPPYLVETVALLGAASSLQLGTAALPAVALACRRFSLRSGATVVGVAVRVGVALLAVGRFGVAGLALAQLLGVVVERLVLAELVQRRIAWFTLRPTIPDRRALRDVSGYALPLLLINVSAQLFAVSDLVAVGALVGASAVGVYQVSSLVPLYIAAVLVVGYNVVFPSLAGSDDSAGQEQATMFLTRLFGYLGGTGLALVAVLRRDVVELLLGRPDDLAEDVLLVLCAMSLANLVVHGLASLLIARGRQRLMARAVAIELPMNIVLTVALVVAFGAVGAAVGTLITAVLMDFLILPIVSRGEFGHPALAITLRHGVVPAAAGVAVALVGAQAARLAGTPAPRLLLAASAAGVVAVAAGLALLGRGGRRTVRDAFAGTPPAAAYTRPT